MNALRNRSRQRSEAPGSGAAKSLPALAAAGVVGAVVIAGVAAGGIGNLPGFGGDGGGDAVDSIPAVSSTVVASTTVAATEPPETTIETTTLRNPLGTGSAGAPVRRLQERLDELGFFPGPIDGQFGPLTRQAVWAFKKLVMQVPREEVDEVVTDEIWQFMQQPIQIEPRRSWKAGETTRNHTEVYLPEQVVAFFIEDEPVLISHASSGTGLEWAEVVTIDPGELGNEDGTEPLRERRMGVSVTPGGVFEYDRFREGRRQSALGGMYDPAYFNYGIAIHGAHNVPLSPASHGCIRVPMAVGEVFHDYVAKGDHVFVWDGVQEPEGYGAQLPYFDRTDHEWAATSTTEAPETTTEAPTTVADAQTTQAPQTTSAPQPTQPPQTPAPTTQAPTTTQAPAPTTTDGGGNGGNGG